MPWTLEWVQEDLNSLGDAFYRFLSSFFFFFLLFYGEYWMAIYSSVRYYVRIATLPKNTEIEVVRCYLWKKSVR